MTRLAGSLVLLCFFFIACNSGEQRTATTPDTPSALQDNKKSVLSYSKRGGEDLVEELYKDVLKNDPELQKLEELMETLPGEQADSLEIFNRFDTKNASYYHNAKNHCSSITDSVLRQRMELLISSSESQYHGKIARHEQLQAALQAKDSALADLRQVLMIARTLPLIGKFQTDNLPSSRPMEDILRKYEEAVKKAEGLSKK